MDGTGSCRSLGEGDSLRLRINETHGHIRSRDRTTPSLPQVHWLARSPKVIITFPVGFVR